jgi:hypothetical protein
MNGKRIVGYTALGSVVLLVAAATYDVSYGWPPIIRTDGYRSLISDFSHATPRESIRKANERRSEWNFDVQLQGGIVAAVKSGDFMTVPELKYSDEPAPRRLYEYLDYSNPIALRTNGRLLYAYWERSLFHTDYWLLVFDLGNRREVQRRRVDARDMPPIERE